MRISSSVGLGISFSSAYAVSTIPGMQNPHCTALTSTKACCTGCNWSIVPKPSMVVTLFAFYHPRQHCAGTHCHIINQTVQAPQSPVPQPRFVPVNLKRAAYGICRISSPSASQHTGFPFRLNDTFAISKPLFLHPQLHEKMPVQR